MMRHGPLFLFSCMLIISCAFSKSYGSTLDQLIEQQNNKLKTSLLELEQQRKKISEAQSPKQDSIHKLEHDISSLREQHHQLLQSQDSEALELNHLIETLQNRDQNLHHLQHTLLFESLLELETNLNIATLQATSHPLNKTFQELKAHDEQSLNYLKIQLKAMEMGIDHIIKLAQPQRLEGEAQNEKGEVYLGSFLQVGPLTFFISEHENCIGQVFESKSLKAEVHPIDPENTKLLKAYLSAESNALPIDPTLSYTSQLYATQDSLRDHLKKGGLWVFPIIFFAAIASLIALFKSLQLFCIKPTSSELIPNLVKAIKIKDTEQIQLLLKNENPHSQRIISSILPFLNEPIELLDEVMTGELIQLQPKLEKFLHLLSITAAIAPLLGLLGTVTGIINTFQLMEVFGAGDPKPLISGISEALITTELGLVLAIPALIMYALLSRRVSHLMTQFEQRTSQIIHLLSKKERANS